VDGHAGAGPREGRSPDEGWKDAGPGENPAAASLRDGIDPYEHLAAKPSLQDRCPHCGGIGQVVADDELRYVCSLCGGPRFSPLADGLVAPESAQAELRKVEKARKWRASWMAAMVTSGIGLGFMVLVMLAFALAGALKAALVVAMIFGMPFAIALFLSMSKRAKHAAQIAPGIDAAWASLAAGAAHAGRAASPAALAKALGVGAEQAEQLHTVLAVDAELGASAPLGSASAGKVRIGGTEIEEPPRSQLAPDPRFDALEKRIATVAPPAAPPSSPAAVDEGVAEEQAAEAEAEAAAMASAKTIVADPAIDPSRR
jgi:voltage-gated potassium channel Kch